MHFVLDFVLANKCDKYKKNKKGQVGTIIENDVLYNICIQVKAENGKIFLI